MRNDHVRGADEVESPLECLHRTVHEEVFSEEVFDEHLMRWIRSGVDRLSAYRELHELSCSRSVTPEASDYLSEVLTTITGDCDDECILRFSEDGHGTEILVTTARSGAWRMRNGPPPKR
ncbi:hypothetical protein [Herbiconiux liangxiaofengii]|uniref:hypothetical protein n=1 Tax=Herbiconiux liangxiaofengii TaxID=3342795 RepID=UPI0035B8220C